MRRVLFACVGNCMRSQMAEGLGRHLARPATVEVRSGGTNPTGFVHPRAVRAMRARGIEIAHQTSKPLDLAFAAKADAVVTLCGPLDDACPAPILPRVVDWTMPDPSWGGDADVVRVRDAIEGRIVDLYTRWGVLRMDALERP